MNDFECTIEFSEIMDKILIFQVRYERTAISEVFSQQSVASLEALETCFTNSLLLIKFSKSVTAPYYIINNNSSCRKQCLIS